MHSANKLAGQRHHFWTPNATGLVMLGAAKSIPFLQPCLAARRVASPATFELFVAVTPASDYTFACVTRSQRTADWNEANEQALRFFGGAPLTIVSDNLKAAVLSHVRGKSAVINPAFQAFCDHHGIVPSPVRPRKPKHKAKVEIGVKLVQRLLRLALRERPLASFEEMNRFLLELVERLNARPLRRAPGETRRTLSEALDRPKLRPLSPERFATHEIRRQLLVGPDYHIMHDHRLYSVPHSFIGRKVDLRVGAAGGVRLRQRSIYLTVGGRLERKHGRWS